MSKAEKTKEFIIEQAAPLFNSKGYAGTSMSDLIAVTGLTKGAIYGNFENKDAIALAAYKYNITSMNSKLDALLCAKKTPFEQLLVFIDFYRNNWKKFFEKGGCPILNAAIEADDNLPFLKTTIQQSIKAWAKRIEQIIISGQQNGDFKENIDALHYAYTMISLIEGGIMLSKILNDPSYLFSSLDRILLIIQQEISIC